MPHILCLMLLACGSPDPTPIVLPPGIEGGSTQAAEPEAPIDARPETTQVRAPSSGSPAPPLKPPEGNRERDWDWAFEYKGATKRSALVARERGHQGLTAADLKAIELGEEEPPQWMLELQDGEPD